MELFGNLIRLHSSVSFHSVYIDLPTLLNTRGREFPQPSVSALPVCSSESEFSKGFLWSVFYGPDQVAARPSLTVVTDVAEGTSPHPDVALKPHVTHCPLVGPAPVWHVCGVWSQAALFVNSSGLCEIQAGLTSLGCGGAAPCLQVNTEEIGLVQTCIMLEGHG